MYGKYSPTIYGSKFEGPYTFNCYGQVPLKLGTMVNMTKRFTSETMTKMVSIPMVTLHLTQKVTMLVSVVVLIVMVKQNMTTWQNITKILLQTITGILMTYQFNHEL